MLLLASSIYFYMTFIPVYIIIIFLVIIIDYTMARLIEKSKGHKKKGYLIVSILSTGMALFTFKYLNFFSQSISNLASFLHWNYSFPTLALILPIGLSFYTLQSLCYVIEVYKGKYKSERNLGIYALYVMFFPQLVAGPIERAKNLLPQFRKKHYFEYNRVTDGLKIMLWGFLKKVVIADRLAVVVNMVYNDPTGYTGVPLLLATIFFAFQIYCDFSGYSDIAIGAAQIMGFKLMDNFRRPYFSRSVSEFWKRWHISLSTWFRDYLYIPLGGNRVSVPRWYFNLFIVFLISGLWHGANWTFIIWGALHGFYLISGIVIKPAKDKLLEITRMVKFPKIIKLVEIGITFILVNLGWIFFRANNVSDAFYIITHLFTNWSFNISKLIWGITPGYIAYCFIFIGFMEFIHLIQEHRSIRHFLNDRPLILRWGIYILLLLLILLFGVFNNTPFIYFQF